MKTRLKVVTGYILCVLFLSCAVFYSSKGAHEIPILFKKKNFGGDDIQFIRDMKDRNSIIKIFSVTELTRNQGTNSHYMPLCLVIFSTIYKYSNGDPQIFVILNCIIHILNGMLIYILFREFIQKKYLIIISCLMFIFHPTQIHTLAWITAGLSHGLVTFTALLSFICFSRYIALESRTYYCLSILCFLFSLLIKPLACGFPLIFFVYSLAVMEKHANLKQIKFKNYVSRILPFVSLFSLIFAIEIYKYPYGNIAKNWGGINLGTHVILRGSDLALRYFSMEHFTVTTRTYLLSAIITLFLISLIHALIKKQMTYLVGHAFFWMPVFLMLSSNFRDISSILRYQYIPSIGMIFLVALFIDDLLSSKKR